MEKMKTTREALQDHKTACDETSKNIETLLKTLPAEYLDAPADRPGGIEFSGLYFEMFRRGPSAS